MTTKIGSRFWMLVLFMSCVAGYSATVVAAEADDDVPTVPDPAWLKQKAILQKLGESQPNAKALYALLKRRAHGGTRLTPATVPNWGGVWYRVGTIYKYDVDKHRNYGPTTANLTPKYQAMYLTKLKQAEDVGIFDPLGSCLPSSMPRWFTEPYLREFSVSPDETWLMNELANETRRVYTDGRGHPDKEDQSPSFDGDSIGFWDGDKLVIHTDELQAGIFQKLEPDHSEQIEVVEVWRKSDANTIVVDVWAYDPEALASPWYTRQMFTKEKDQNSLRIRYYDCVGTPNTRVEQGKDGSTNFIDLNFDKKPPGDHK